MPCASISLEISVRVISRQRSRLGISGAGKLLFGPDKRHDIRFMLTYGNGIGRYVGLNFAPDGLFAGTPGSDILTVKNLAGFAAVRFAWTKTVRSTFMASKLSGPYRHHAAYEPAGMEWGRELVLVAGQGLRSRDGDPARRARTAEWRQGPARPA